MKCIILAAGKGVRMGDLTKNTPKSLLKVSGKTILEHIISSLPDRIDEVGIVVHYLGSKIKEHIGESYANKKITYVPIERTIGTYDALLHAADFMTGKTLVMNADDLHGKQALEMAIRKELCLVVAPSKNPERFGVVALDRGGILIGIEEKPENPRSNLVSTGAMVVDERIFKYKIEKSVAGEYYLTDALSQLSREHKIETVRQEFWIPIGYPEDIEKAEKMLGARRQ